MKKARKAAEGNVGASILEAFDAGAGVPGPAGAPPDLRA